MRDCEIMPLNSYGEYTYTVILSFYQGQIVLSQHRDRQTWETQGGHIEQGETPLNCARRELYEESGAQEFDIIELFDYSFDGLNGRVFCAMIHSFETLPKLEMKRIGFFDELPSHLTYPEITPYLFAEYKRYQTNVDKSQKL